MKYDKTILAEVNKLSQDELIKYEKPLIALKSHRIIIDGDKKGIDTNPVALLKLLDKPFTQTLDIINTYIQKGQLYHSKTPKHKLEKFKDDGQYESTT